MTVSTVLESGDQAAAMSAPNDVQARRVLALRRAYQRELAHKPTLIQKTLIDRAATLTALAERTALDSAVTLDDLVRVDNKAAQARAEMFASFAKRERVPVGSDLDTYLARRGAAA
jgi:hypothetical protein